MELKVIVVTGRSLAQGRAKEKKFTEEYRQAVATCEIDPDDLASLGIQAGQNVRLANSKGSIVLKAVKSSQSPHRGIFFVAYGPWVNVLTDSDSDGTGMPTLKGIEAEVEPAPGEEVQDLRGLLRKNLMGR